jgi:hypothetical protein
MGIIDRGNMINKVFISHNVGEKDLSIIEKFAEVLKEDNITPILPVHDPRPSIPVYQGTKEDLASSDFVLVIWTKDGEGSQFVNQELEEAFKHNKQVMVVMEEGAEPSSELRAATLKDEPIVFNRDNIMSAVTKFASRLPCPNV